MIQFLSVRVSAYGLRLLSIFGLLFAALAPSVRASGGRVDYTFQAEPNGVVTCLARQADGRVVIGGEFTSVSGVMKQGIARINADGSLDLGFAASTNGYLRTIFVQANGKIVLIGDFQTVNGTARLNIARLNSDGTLDATFEPLFDGYLWCIGQQADGKLLIGGEFFAVGVDERQGLARLNTDGTLDADFDAGISGSVYSLIVQSSGKIVVGGDFLDVGGEAAQNLARVLPDATRDMLFTGTAASFVFLMTAQLDGKILASVFEQGLTRFGIDGANDAAFSPPPFEGIGTIAIQADGKILVGGYDLKLEIGINNDDGSGPEYTTGIVRLGPNGVLDSSFNARILNANEPEPYGDVRAIVLQPDGKLLAGGDFSEFGGSQISYLGRMTTAGTPLDGGLAPEFVASCGEPLEINAFAIQPDGKVLVGGWFHFFNGEVHPAIVRLNYPDGTVDSTFNNGTFPVGRIDSIVVQPDGKILVGGSFDSINNIPRANLARLNANGSVDMGFQADVTVGTEQGPGFVTAISCLPVGTGLNGHTASGQIVIGGYFTHVNGVARLGVAGLESDGSVVSFAPDNGPVHSILYVEQTASVSRKLVFGGGANAISSTNMSGTIDALFGAQLPASFGGGEALARESSGTILAGGSGLYRISAQTGALDTTLTTGTTDGIDGIVWSIATQADGKILISGGFGKVNGIKKLGIARLLLNGKVDGTFKAGADDYVWGLMIHPDGSVLAGGSFTKFNGISKSCIAKLNTYDSSHSLNVLSPTEIFWARGGSSPSVEQVVFEYSIDNGGTWQPIGTGLGSGQHVSPYSTTYWSGTVGWQLTNFNLQSIPPYHGFVRVTGRTHSGHSNGSAGIIQEVVAYSFNPPLQPPTLITPAPNSTWARPVTVSYTLPAEAGDGSVKLRFSTGATFYELVLAGSQETSGSHSFTFDPVNPTAASEVASGPAIPFGVYSVTLSYTDVTGDNNATSSPHTNVTINTSPYAQWKQDFLGDAGAPDLGDPESDGLVNLLEYSLGLNPLASDPGDVPPAVNEGGYLTMTLTKRPGITYFIETAATPANASFSTTDTTILINDATTLKVRDNFQIGIEPKRFMRVRVTAP